MHDVRVRVCSFLVALCLTFGMLPLHLAYADGHTDYTPRELLETAEDIIAWEKRQVGAAADDNLFNNAFLQIAGTTNTDWTALAMGRCGRADDYNAYLAVLADQVTKKYTDDRKLSSDKATEWHRMALTVLSLGGDPTTFGKDAGGNAVNLIADGVYDRGRTESLGEQGINGWVYGLIALDSLRYRVPEGASDTRRDIICQILKLQLDDGDFALDTSSSGNASDVDLTAMAVQALAPYYNSEETYEIKRYKNQETKTVRQAVDAALACLSESQQDDGGFVSWSMSNSESCCQVIVALCSLGIDPCGDSRFIKGENTVLDALMGYKNDDGGFIHSHEYDEENPDADPDKSNGMATQQAFYALTALCRYYGDMRTLYDFRPEMDDKVKAQAEAARQAIDGLKEDAAPEALTAAYLAYLEVPVEERSYIYNYHKLADLMKTADLPNDSEYLAAAMEQNTGGNGTVISLFGQDVSMTANITFTEEDVQKATNIPDNGSTEYYVDVIKLLDKLDKAENADQHNKTRKLLEQKKEAIAATQQEINDINGTVTETLYPVDQISLGDKKAVEHIEHRIAALSDYDRQQILQYEDIEQASARIRNQVTAICIAAAAMVLAVVLLIIVMIRIKKRRAEKIRQEQRYDNEIYDDDDEYDDGED
ncbi:terpene cyclase/mutase family protein [Ruminococcus sp. OA3]|uniref:prenyltransferase/squalene oxidase repeat-containing protein n=1 Tax=Ruminococcus sp. OA3 TaxID=2914164 RepID=UPI001F06A406|nr:prenyltransferase/squalene oxidase repeat-containing protein [Ruminococcus sp. OA3]MCH1981944.1 terpene cyclase/mutase family protein [Ruminococcus sp. OA3]